MNTCLEKVVFPDDRMEERLHVDTTVFVSVKFEEGRSTEEVSKFQLQFGCYCQKRIVIESLLVIMWRREILSKKLVQFL